MALEHARVCIDALMNMKSNDIEKIAGDKRKIAEKLIRHLHNERVPNGRAQVALTEPTPKAHTQAHEGNHDCNTIVDGGAATHITLLGEIEKLKKKIETLDKKIPDMPDVEYTHASSVSVGNQKMLRLNKSKQTFSREDMQEQNLAQLQREMAEMQASQREMINVLASSGHDVDNLSGRSKTNKERQGKEEEQKRRLFS